MIWKIFFSRKVLLSPFALFLMALHVVCNLSTCVEYWADGKDYDFMLMRFPLGFLLIGVILFFFTLGGFALAKANANA